jgi:hypothetical protein
MKYNEISDEQTRNVRKLLKGKLSSLGTLVKDTKQTQQFPFELTNIRTAMCVCILFNQSCIHLRWWFPNCETRMTQSLGNYAYAFAPLISGRHNKENQFLWDFNKFFRGIQLIYYKSNVTNIFSTGSQEIYC